MENLLLATPVPPDFLYCDLSYSYFGAPFQLADCLQAEALMPRGDHPVRYHHTDNDVPTVEHDVELPLSYRYETCQIAIDVIDPFLAGRPNADAWYGIKPNEFREMAGWVIQQCVGSASFVAISGALVGVGGFVTRNISRAINYLRLPAATLDRNTWPLNATFFTLTITPNLIQAVHPYAGDYDPTVGGALFSSIYEILMSTLLGSPLWSSLNRMAESLNYHWGRMGRAYDYDHGYGRPWWGTYGETTFPKEAMTYACDEKLGNPQHVDCSQLQYSQLDPISDSLSLEPGLAKFLHSETCNIGISVIKSTTVTWKQIKSTVDEIIEICVNNPLRKAVGGRSSYGHQALFDIGLGKRRKRDADSLTALPPGVNVTLFQQLEYFPTTPTDSEEVKSCTWQKALDMQDVRPCRSVHHRPQS